MSHFTFHHSVTHIVLRSPRHTAMRCRPSTPAKPLRTSIGFMLTLQSSMKKVVRTDKQNRTSIVLVKFLNGQPKSISRPLKTLQRSGASGLRWSSDTSEFQCLFHRENDIQHTVVITMRLSASRSVVPPFPKVQRSITMITYVPCYYHKPLLGANKPTPVSSGTSPSIQVPQVVVFLR